MGRNARSVWTIATEAFPGAHFATFPTELVRRCLLAGSPAKCCPICGAGWVRMTEREFIPQPDVSLERGKYRGKMYDANGWNGFPRGSTSTKTLGFRPSCSCHAADTRPGIVLDPFIGSGTTALVARSLGRHFLGCDLSAEYVNLARERLRLPFEAHHVPPPDFAPPADKDYGNGEVQLALPFSD